MKRIRQIITLWLIPLAGLMIAIGAAQAGDYSFKYKELYYKVTKNTPPLELKVVPEKTGSDHPYYSAGNEPTGAITIPESFIRKAGMNTFLYNVTEIGDRAFDWCEGITSVTIPNSVTAIGALAFFNCIALKSITIPNSVTAIGEKAFMYCETLKSVTLPNGIQEIKAETFGHCYALQSIDIPASVTAIGDRAFKECTSLKTVTVHWDTPLAVPGNVFEGVNTAGVTLKVPKDTKAKYKNAAVWKEFKIDDGTPDVEPVTGVTLAPNTLTIAPGEAQTLTATVQPATATNKSMTWTSTDNSIATVDASGTVKGVSPGTATITVKTTDGGHTAMCGVTVKSTVVPVTDVTLSHHKVTVNGDINSKQLTATVQPAAATNKSVKWTSSNAAIASVDADGLVTIHKKGQATVTATATDGSGKSDACLFDVLSTVANQTIEAPRIYAADGALHLTLPSPTTVYIYGISGAMVKTLTLPAGNHVQPLPTGVYMVRVGETVEKIFVK